MKNGEIVPKYGLKDTSNVSKIWASRMMITQAYEAGYSTKRKTLKQSAHPQLEKCLNNFIANCNSSGININTTLIKEKSSQIANDLEIKGFAASNGFTAKCKNVTFL